MNAGKDSENDTISNCDLGINTCELNENDSGETSSLINRHCSTENYADENSNTCASSPLKCDNVSTNVESDVAVKDNSEKGDTEPSKAKIQHNDSSIEFSDDDLQMSSPSGYQPLNVLGNGAFGTVFLGRDNSNKAYVALKRIKIAVENNGLPANTLREITTLKYLGNFNHPNIVKLLDVCYGGGNLDSKMSLSLVFEYVPIDLDKFKSQNAPLSEDTIRWIVYQIMCGVDFLHVNRVVHRDLKPQNILITKSLQVKIADFGLARTYDFYCRFTSVVVTLWYRAPEVLMEQSYDTSVDLWSIGCIFAEMFLEPENALFAGITEIAQMKKIFSIMGLPYHNMEWLSKYSLSGDYTPKPLETVVPGIPPVALDLLKELLVLDPKKRIQANVALNHEYFKGFDAPIWKNPNAPPIFNPCGSSLSPFSVVANSRYSFGESTAPSYPKNTPKSESFNVPSLSKRSLDDEDHSRPESAKRRRHKTPSQSGEIDSVDLLCYEGVSTPVAYSISGPEHPHGFQPLKTVPARSQDTHSKVSSASDLNQTADIHTPGTSALMCGETMPDTPVSSTNTGSFFEKVQQFNDENNRNAGNKPLVSSPQTSPSDTSQQS